MLQTIMPWGPREAGVMRSTKEGRCMQASTPSGFLSVEYGGTRMQGYDIAKRATMEFLDSFAETVDTEDREMLRCVARCAPAGAAAAFSRR